MYSTISFVVLHFQNISHSRVNLFSFPSNNGKSFIEIIFRAISNIVDCSDCTKLNKKKKVLKKLCASDLLQTRQYCENCEKSVKAFARDGNYKS